MATVRTSIVATGSLRWHRFSWVRDIAREFPCAPSLDIVFFGIKYPWHWVSTIFSFAKERRELFNYAIGILKTVWFILTSDGQSLAISLLVRDCSDEDHLDILWIRGEKKPA